MTYSQHSFKTLNELNFALHTLGLRGYFLQRGYKIYYRRQLPPKAKNNTQWLQQDVALQLSLTPAGFKRAFQIALEIDEQCIQGCFNWIHYSRRYLAAGLEIKFLKKKYEENYFEGKERNATTESSWKGNDLPILNRLPNTGFLTEELIKTTIEDTPPNSAARKRVCFVLKKLAKLAELTTMIDFKKLQGHHTVKERFIPSDELIWQAYNLIPDPEWRFVYGALAVFPLRPHEAILANYDTLRAGEDFVRVPEATKTGNRVAYPLDSAWIEQFNLRQIVIPTIKLDGMSNKEVGSSVTKFFTKYKIPFKPYDLRHAWAIRSIKAGLDPRTAAKWMGHSLDVHFKTYNHWFSEFDSQQIYKSLQNNKK